MRGRRPESRCPAKENSLQVLTKTGPIATLRETRPSERVNSVRREVVTVNFDDKVSASGRSLRKQKLQVLQINMGKYCNQSCFHCHVEAGPGRKEMMERTTVERRFAVP